MIRIYFLLLMSIVLALNPFLLYPVAQQNTAARARSLLQLHRHPDPSRAVTDTIGVALRRTRALQYNTPFHTKLTEVEGNVTLANTSRSHLYREMSSLPVADSTTIVIGSVVDFASYFSDNETAIYSEYSVAVTTVLRPVAENAINAGERLSCIREGGTIILPRGNTVSWLVVGQGFPKVGEKYLLFLKWKQDEQIYQILRAYLFEDDETVFSIDYGANNQSPYAGVSSDTFVASVKSAISAHERR